MWFFSCSLAASIEGLRALVFCHGEYTHYTDFDSIVFRYDSMPVLYDFYYILDK